MIRVGRASNVGLSASLLLLPALAAAGPPDDPPEKDDKAAATPAPARLTMSPAIACESVQGFGQYVPLADPTLTADDKLLLYYQPSNHAFEPVKDGFRVHLVQDARIRRRGEKPVLRSKEKVVDYDAVSPHRPLNLYLANTISLKGLAPGDYDLDIILRDVLGGGSRAEQTLRFSIKAARPAPADAKGKPPEADEPAKSSAPKGKGLRKGRG